MHYVFANKICSSQALLHYIFSYYITFCFSLVKFVHIKPLNNILAFWIVSHNTQRILGNNIFRTRHNCIHLTCIHLTMVKCSHSFLECGTMNQHVLSDGYYNSQDKMVAQLRAWTTPSKIRVQIILAKIHVYVMPLRNSTYIELIYSDVTVVPGVT